MSEKKTQDKMECENCGQIDYLRWSSNKLALLCSGCIHEREKLPSEGFKRKFWR